MLWWPPACLPKSLAAKPCTCSCVAVWKTTQAQLQSRNWYTVILMDSQFARIFGQNFMRVECMTGCPPHLALRPSRVFKKPGPRRSCFLTVYQTSGRSTCYFCLLALESKYCRVLSFPERIHCEHVWTLRPSQLQKQWNVIKCAWYIIPMLYQRCHERPGKCPWKWRLLSMHVPEIWRSLLTMTMSTC